MELIAIAAHLVGTALTRNLSSNLLHQSLALVSTQILEGGDISDTVAMHPHQVHDVTDAQPWEDGSAG